MSSEVLLLSDILPARVFMEVIVSLDRPLAGF